MISRTRVISSSITGLLVFTLLVRAQETRGTPGIDYPDYYSIPKTSFSCSEQKYVPGFYADLETKCQVFHLCLKDRQESFLCPTGAIYNQEKLTCDSWYNSNCSLAPSFYNANSGPVMERASQSIPMLIKLRNRSQKRQSVLPPTNVYEKIASLYVDGTDEVQSGTKTSNLAEDVNAESNPEINRETGSVEVSEETQGPENESQLNEDVQSRTDEIIQNDDESQEVVYYEDTSGQVAEDDIESGIFYDPVTEQYYVDYDARNEWQQDPQDDEFKRVYDYDSFKYGLPLKDYLDERFSYSEEVSTESVVNDLDEFNEQLGTVEMDEDEQLGRMMDAGALPKSLRRKPMYTMVDEDDEVRIPSVARDIKYPTANSDVSFFTTEPVSASGDAASELLEEIVAEYDEMADQANTEPPLEMSDELRNPSFTPLNSSEIPLTSAEFEQRILTELVQPKIDELDLRVISFPSEEQQEEESSESVSQDYQSDDQDAFVEKLIPNDYESYSTNYNEDDIVIVERPDSDHETPGNENADLYQSGEIISSEDEVGADDTYVVIPDESDASELDQDSDTNERSESIDEYSYFNPVSDEQSQSDVAYDSYEALRDYFLSNYASDESHAPVGPYRLQTPEFYFSNEYGRQQPYMQEGFLDPEKGELLQSPYQYAVPTGAASDQQMETGFAYQDSPDSYYPFVESGSYIYEQPAHYAYGAENRYPYGEAYANGYFDKANTNFGYDASEMENTVEFSNETPEVAFKVNHDYSEPGIPSWIQGDSAENSETEKEQLGVSDRSITAEDFLASFDASESGTENFYGISVPDESEDVSFEDAENMKKDETYYLFDFDEDRQENEEVQPEGSAGTSETDTEQLDLKVLFQAEKPLKPGEPLEERSSVKGGSESESTETAEETIIFEGDLDSKDVNMKSSDVSESTADAKSRETTDSWLFQDTEISQANEKPVTLSSVLEQLAVLNTERTSRSDAANINLSRNKFFSNKPLPESVDLGPYGVNGGQQYRMTDASTLLSPDNVFAYRTGNFQQPSTSKLLDIQKRIRSLKQGKFGAFKKYMSSAGRKE